MEEKEIIETLRNMMVTQQELLDAVRHINTHIDSIEARIAKISLLYKRKN